MFRICTIVKRVAREAVAAAALAFLCAPVEAHIGPPVKVSLATADAPRRGEASTIYVVLQAGADVDQAEYTLAPPAGWQIVDGPTQWTGALKAGQRIEFLLKAIPLSDEPGELQASIKVPRQLDYKATLRTERMGGNFPEKGGVDESAPAKGGNRGADEILQPQFEPGARLPEPANATEPRLPGQPISDAPIIETRANKGQRMATVSINATGRFTYLDDNGVRRPVRFATVELWNENPFPSLGDERCAKGITDANGNFALGASCGDLFDGPDLFVRLILNNSVVEVKPDNIFAGSYTFRSSTKQNSPGGDVAFGTLTLTSNRQAAQAHNLVMRAHQFMTTLNENMSKVTVLWPGDATFYQGAFDTITLERNRPFEDEAAIFHEYGHHILSTRAESPNPDYDNGICDDPTPGHCIFSPEKGRISWTEGWPDFLGAFLHARHNAEDGYGATGYQFETLPALNVSAADRDNVEGIVAGILWDLLDTTNDDQGEQGPGRRDDFSMAFSTMWNVIRNFDPSSDLLHNHPTSIHELFEGFQELQPGSINKIAEIYREHGIVKPQPDVTMTALENPPTQLPRGTVFNLSSTVHNEGNERVNANSTVRFQLVNTAIDAAVTIGSRIVPGNMAAGASNTAAVNVTVPLNAPRGTYILRACADATNVVPESDENNNCRSAGQTSVQ